MKGPRLPISLMYGSKIYQCSPCCNCINFHLISGDSFLKVDPCNSKDSVTVTVCVSVGTNLTISCNLHDTSAAWMSPQFESPALISPTIPTKTRLNNTVVLQFIRSSYNDTTICLLSDAIIQNVQPSVNGVNIVCSPNVHGRSRANITIFTIGE